MQRVLRLCLISLMFSTTSVSAQPFNPPTPTHMAIQDGLWHLPNTWENGLVPDDGASVLIPIGKRVIVTTQETARLDYIQVEGEMRMTIQADTRLWVETLFVGPTGFFMIGHPSFTVEPDKTAELVFISDGQPIDRTWDPTEASRGFISAGKVRIYGHPRTHMAEMDLSALAGQTAIDLRLPVPADWQVGDEIVLAGTHFRRDTTSQEEHLTITGINGQVISFEPPLAYDHARVRVDLNLHIAHLTRNVILRSESADLPLRGHVMLMHSDVDIQHAAFIDLGRTNKAIPLDEIIVDVDTGAITPNSNIQNRRGRYAVHFHRNGIQPGSTAPSKVHGSVIIGTPGWGYVNHSSHVDFQRNVAYDFVGSGFVTEAGDELGNFIDNIAIRGTGTGEYFPSRQVFMNDTRPQPLSDFAFAGDGFWFQGPAVRARDNVANSCNGAGMIWFATGAVDIDTHHYVGFPRSAVADAYAGMPDIANLEARNWQYDADALVISDLPILECDGFDAYANLVGFHIRFNNFDNIAFYNEDPFDYDLEINGLPGQPFWFAERIRQRVSRLNLWNNETGFRVRYNEKTDWSDVINVNQLRYYTYLGVHGAELVHQTKDNTFDSLLIGGYAVAGLIETTSGATIVDNRSEITFSNTVYENYVHLDTHLWGVVPACDPPIGVSVSAIAADSVQLSWNGHSVADRMMVRFKAASESGWRFRPALGTTTSVALTQLFAASDYEVQVIAGCPDNVSYWSAPLYFATLP